MVGRERRAAAAAGVGRWPTPCCPTPQHRSSHSGRPTSADPRRAHPARRRPPQPTGRGAPRRRRADHHLPRGAAGLRPARGHRGRDPGPPGGDRRGRDRLGKDHPDPQDPARARAGPGRPDRAHPAPADRRGAISAELFVDPFGSIVGYQVRFTDQSSEQTLVKVMTDGILLAQIQRDPRLLAYDTLIIDEAHERSLNIDFILGYLTRLLPQRPDLKVVITSATIDSERFARHFAGPPTPERPDGVPAPVVQVTGRTYPVEVRYQPLVADREDPDAGPADPDDPSTAEWSVPATTRGRVVPERSTSGRGRGRQGRPPQGHGASAPAEDRDVMTAICEAVDELCAEGPGDILVFLSGEREIRDAEDALRSHLGPRVTDAHHPRAVELLPLYARLSSAEQHRVFARHTTRRVILATNVAETSLTVPGVRYVVDPGTARISRWSKATKVQRLPIEPVSQASANQRAGRCGRVADGIAI